MLYRLQALLICLLVWQVSSASAQAPVPNQPSFTLDTGRLAVRVAPKRAYTLDRVLLSGVELGRPNGNYGFVYHEGNNQWIGSGHTEGGREQVEKVTLVADGRVLAQPYPATNKAKRFELTKESTVGGFKLTSRIVLTEEEIAQSHDLEVLESMTVETAYGFMHCWTPATTEWVATTLEGNRIEGSFDNAGWEVRDDVRWLALYEPESGSVILTEFPPDLPRGQGLKHAVWDLEAYHKQYYQAWRQAELKAGETHTFRMTVKAFKADADRWKDQAASTAHEYEGGYSIAEERDDVDAGKEKTPAQIALEAARGPIDPADPPRWLTEPVAMEALAPETVLEPWTPIVADDKRVEVWGRTHELGAWGLPRQVTAAGEPLLAEPIALEIELADGRTLEPGAVRLVEQHDGRVRYRATATQGDAKVSLDSTYEFDGMMRFDLTFGQETRVERLTLKVPLHEEQAMFLQHASAWKLGVSQQNTAVSRAVPEGDGEVYHYGFSPFLWLGGYDRGFSWFSESDEHWTPAKGDRAIRLAREDGQVQLHIDIVAQPTTLHDGAGLTFGFMATPVKPLPEGWRGRRITSALGSPQPGDEMIYWYDQYRVVRHDPTPRDMDAFAADVQRLNEAGVHRVYPYIDVTLMSRGEKVHLPNEDFHFVPPEWEAYGESWMIQPNYKSYTYLRVSPASTWADFSLNQVKRYITEGNASGIYLDESFPYADTAEAHGMGYTDATGTRQPTYAVFATRDYYKRLAYLFETHGKGRPSILSHTSSTIAVPYLSMADIQLTGEQYYHNMRHWEQEAYPSYIEMAPLEDFHAEHRGVQFGFVPSFLPVYKGIHRTQWPHTETEPGPTRELLALTLLHDVLVWPLWCHAESVHQTQRVKAAYGIGDSDVVYHPYWRETEPVYESDSDQVKVSYYSKSAPGSTPGTTPGSASDSAHGSVLMVVSNLGDQPSRVRVDPARLPGLASSDDLTAMDAEADQPLEIDGGRAVIEVPPKDYRLIRLDAPR